MRVFGCVQVRLVDGVHHAFCLTHKMSDKVAAVTSDIIRDVIQEPK
jgi:hypothetical protein